MENVRLSCVSDMSGARHSANGMSNMKSRFNWLAVGAPVCADSRRVVDMTQVYREVYSLGACALVVGA